MKPIATLFTLLLVCCAPSCSQATPPPTAASAYPSDYTELLKTYVTPEGVRYAAMACQQGGCRADEEGHRFFCINGPPADRSESFAWHLNAYNAWILNNILAKYPTKGPMEEEVHFLIAMAS